MIFTQDRDGFATPGAPNPLGRFEITAATTEEQAAGAAGGGSPVGLRRCASRATSPPTSRHAHGLRRRLPGRDPRARRRRVPAPPPDHPDPWTVWSNWLAGRGLGLVPIADPAGFSWPGPWLAVLRGEARAGLRRGVRAAVRRSPGTRSAGRRRSPTSRRATSSHRPTSPCGRLPRDSARHRRGAWSRSRSPPRPRPRSSWSPRRGAHAGRGLEGDRYHEGRGTFSKPYANGHELTLVEAEALDEPASPRRRPPQRRHARDRPQRARRPALPVGEVECIGRRLCEPCAHLERLSPGTLRPLVHLAGLRADLLGDGAIRVGDAVSG